MKWRWGVSGIMFGFTHPVSAWLAWCLMFVSCVFSVDMLCAYIRHFLSSPHSAQLFCLHCTLVWLWCHEMYSYLLSSPSSPDPMVSRYSSTNLHCIIWTRSSLQIPSCSVVKLSSPALASWHKGTNNSQTPPYYGHTSSSQIPGLYHIQHIDRIEMVDDHDVKVARVSLGKG